MADRAYNYFLLRRKKRLMNSAGQIQLSAQSITSGALTGDDIGTLSVPYATATYTFAITDDPDSLFALDGDILELAADAFDVGDYTVTIEGTPDDDSDVLTRTFTISVVALGAALVVSEASDFVDFDLTEVNDEFDFVWGAGNSLEWGSGNSMTWGA